MNNNRKRPTGSNYVIRGGVVCAAVLCAMAGFWAANRQTENPADATGLDSVTSEVHTSSTAPSASVRDAAFKHHHHSTEEMAAASMNAREFDLSVNPYAAVLRAPGVSMRAWDRDFLEHCGSARKGEPIQFELTDGMVASGVITTIKRDADGIKYLGGELRAPESGTFFFLRPPAGGRAGSAVGVIQFPASQTAYRIEPTGDEGAPELWQRRMDEVLCMNMPALDESAYTENAPPLRPDQEDEYVPDYNEEIVSLQSLPGATGVIYLDFSGGFTDEGWGDVWYSRPAVDNARIRDIWKRVAEDYMPLNINVTTDRKIYEAAPEGSRQRCAIASDAPTVAGVAYFGSWNWSGDTVCWCKYTDAKSGAEVIAHEVGHTVGLSHQTQDFDDGEHSEYFGGHNGPGNTGWAPIMGAGYYQPVTTWARGEYEYAGQHEDELSIMDSYNEVDFRTDDAGSSLAAARYLEAYSDNTVFAEGLIGSTGDSDAFRFTTTGGNVSFNADVVGDWSDLALKAEIQNASGITVISSNPQDSLSASLNTTLSAGTYTIRVTGVGRNSALTDGFSSYASMGYYSISGSVAGITQPSRFSVDERSPVGTKVGTVTFPYLGSHSLTYSIISGNTDNAFALNNSGVLTVANPAALIYANLAYGTQQTVQYELFVNITDATNPSQSESNRRVVVEVVNVPEPAAQLIHRWNFSSMSDLIGGADATIIGSAYLSGGQLRIPGGAARANCASVNLNDTLSTNASLTVEGWFTMNALQNWSKVWMFGQPNGGAEPGLGYLDFTPRAGAAGNVPSMSLDTGLLSTESNTRTGENPALLTTGVEYHAAAVYDTDAGMMSLYLNGVLVDSASMHEANVTQIAATESFFGAAVHWGDPNLNGSINEMRIYNGAVIPFQLAVNAAAGPDDLVSNPGALTAIRLVVPNAEMTSLSAQDVKVYADFSNVENVDITSAGATFTSGNSSIITVDDSGSIKAFAPGTTTLLASYGGMSDMVSLTVAEIPTVLAHRWSFDDGTDSVGSANAELVGSASWSGGQLILPGGAERSNYASVNIRDTLTSTVSLSVESWFTMNALQDWAKLWMFGTVASDAGDPLLAFVEFTPRTGDGGGFPSVSYNPSTDGGVNTRSGDNPSAMVTGEQYYTVTTFDASGDVMSLYVNGVLVDSGSMGGGTIAQMASNPTDGYIGAAIHYNDPCLTGSVDEMRVWKGVLSASQIAFNALMGPDSSVTDPGELTAVRLEVTTNSMARGTTQSCTVFAEYSNVPSLDVTGSGVTYSSGSPGVVRVDSDGVLHAVGAGTATITATWGGISGEQMITVTGATALAHRWSFNNNDGTDSVGGADATLVGSASFSGGQLRIPGGAARANAA
ncbi:MAG: Ig-like domain-containing protein, partial [Pontiellaceae bacterium]|nr:Ig-like domain-containing protein [Pontiellaceae bacterium]